MPRIPLFDEVDEEWPKWLFLMSVIGLVLSMPWVWVELGLLIAVVIYALLFVAAAYLDAFIWHGMGQLLRGLINTLFGWLLDRIVPRGRLGIELAFLAFPIVGWVLTVGSLIWFLMQVADLAQTLPWGEWRADVEAVCSQKCFQDGTMGRVARIYTVLYVDLGRVILECMRRTFLPWSALAGAIGFAKPPK